MLMLIELTFLIPIGGQWSGLEEHLDFCILCVCTRVCVCTCTLPLPGHAQALSSPWTWVQGHAAAAFPLLGRPVLKTKQSLPLGLALPWGSWNTACRDVSAFPPWWSFSDTCSSAHGSLPGEMTTEHGGHKTLPQGSFPLPGDLSHLSIPGAAHWGCSSLLLSNTSFCLQLFLQEWNAQTQRKAPLSPQRQKGQAQ